MQAPRRIPLLLFAAALMVHGVFALTITTPVDWDPAYYRQVAQNIASGNGAVTQSVLFYGYLPQQLPFAADLHWMPLPSRVLVPAMALGQHGDQLTTVVLAATWAPLAWALGRELGGDGVTAGALAVFGGGYVRFLSTPDSIALYGALAGVAALAIARERYGWATLAVAAAALTRGDGALLAPCLAAPLVFRQNPWSLMLGLAGPAAYMVWLVRCDIEGGMAWEASRVLIGQTLDYSDFVLGLSSAPTPAARALHLAQELPHAVKVALIAGAGLLPWPALWALNRTRAPWALGLALYAVAMPLAALTLAPGVADSGTVFRSGSALFVGACALAGVGLDRLCSWRQYPRWLPVAAFGVASLALGAFNAHLVPSVAWTCPPGESTVFATRPLLCERPALLLPVGMHPRRIRELSNAYGIEEAWLTPSDGLGWGSEEPKLVPIDSLSGWPTSP